MVEQRKVEELLLHHVDGQTRSFRQAASGQEMVQVHGADVLVREQAIIDLIVNSESDDGPLVYVLLLVVSHFHTYRII
jgi:hypothetical protein